MFPLCWDLSLDILERIAAIGMEVGMSEHPALNIGLCQRLTFGVNGEITHMLAKLIVICVFHLGQLWDDLR